MELNEYSKMIRSKYQATGLLLGYWMRAMELVCWMPRLSSFGCGDQKDEKPGIRRLYWRNSASSNCSRHQTPIVSRFHVVRNKLCSTSAARIYMRRESRAWFRFASCFWLNHPFSDIKFEAMQFNFVPRPYILISWLTTPTLNIDISTINPTWLGSEPL